MQTAAVNGEVGLTIASPAFIPACDAHQRWPQVLVTRSGLLKILWSVRLVYNPEHETSHFNCIPLCV